VSNTHSSRAFTVSRDAGEPGFEGHEAGLHEEDQGNAVTSTQTVLIRAHEVICLVDDGVCGERRRVEEEDECLEHASGQDGGGDAEHLPAEDGQGTASSGVMLA